MKRYAKFGYAAPFRFRVIFEKPQGEGQNDPPPTRAKVKFQTRLLHLVKICSKNSIEANIMRDRETKTTNFYRLSLRNVTLMLIITSGARGRNLSMRGPTRPDPTQPDPALPDPMTLLGSLYLWNGLTDSRAVFFVRCHHSINFVFDRHRYPERVSETPSPSVTPRPLVRLRSNLVCG